jgi:hypothetical protein
MDITAFILNDQGVKIRAFTLTVDEIPQVTQQILIRTNLFTVISAENNQVSLVKSTQNVIIPTRAQSEYLPHMPSYI